MPLYFAFYQNCHADLERLTCLGLEISGEHLLSARPTRGAHFGGGTVDELHIEVSVLAAETVHLRFDPIGRRQTFVQRLSYEST